MIIIDDDTEVKLTQALKAYLRDPSDMSALQFAFPPAITREQIQTVLPSAVAEEIDDPETRIYYRDNGDVLIIAARFYTRQAHKVAIKLAKALDLPLLNCNFHFFELRQQAGKILAILEQGFAEIEAKKQQEAEALRQTIDLQRAARKRHAILDTEFLPDTSAAIHQKRSSRTAPEIMMIEDDAFSRRLVENILAKQYRLTGIGDTGSALPAYVNAAPDLLFLDINLPDVTGHELLEKILLLDPEAYVVMLSGNADRDNVTEAMRRGAKGFIAKPFTPEKLNQYIQRCPTMVH